MTAASPRTQADPNGIAKLYLPTLEIPLFFKAYLKYYDVKKQHNQRNLLITLGIYLFISFIILIWLFSEFSLADDDEFGFFLVFGIVFIIGLIAVFVILSSQKKALLQQRGKGELLAVFFERIQKDLHPDSGLKGLIDHRKHQAKHRYKTKTSPNSGSKKNYYKYPWAVLKFTLIDGTSIRLKCVDKLKEKGGALVRFQEIQKGRVLPNDLIYEIDRGMVLNFRNDLTFSTEDLQKNAASLGIKMLDNFKHFYSHLHRRSEPLIPKTMSMPEETPHEQRFKALKDLLASSEIEFQIHELGEGLELSFRPSGQSKPTILWIELGAFSGEAFVSVRLGIQGQSPEAERLLRANPALAYGRFAYYSTPHSERKQLCLMKTLLWETLDREELETAITGLAALGNKLGEMKSLPQKSKAYRADRHPQWEKMLLENALQGLPVSIESVDKKFKLKLALKQGRFQTVHVRFDRQDIEGNQLISLLSYCGHQSAEFYQKVLEENSHWSYGAVGLASLGPEEMFVVSDNQLAETADPPELRTAILHVADKADQLEALLSGGVDIY